MLDEIVQIQYAVGMDEQRTALETLIAHLSVEIPILMRSGEGWEVVIHGKGESIRVEAKRTWQVTSPARYGTLRVLEERG